MDYQTRFSQYAKSKNVRESYRHLPLQVFWTWLTGKSCKASAHAIKNSQHTLLKEWQLLLQLIWSWGIVILSITLTTYIMNSEISLIFKVVISLICILLVTNRTRGLLHTFHYTSHGAVLLDKKK